VEGAPEGLSGEELAALDAGYKPFPAFGEWPHDASLSPAWAEASRDFKTIGDRVTEEALAGAVDFVMRAAAIDTGAIEGLYDVDHGLTYTVATQAVAWQEALTAKGENVRALFEAQLSAYQLVLDAATESLPVTEVWIRRLHE
jgi:hypothetical protein